MSTARQAILIIDTTDTWTEWASRQLREAGYAVVAERRPGHVRQCGGSTYRVVLVDLAEAERHPDMIRRLANASAQERTAVAVMVPRRLQLTVSPASTRILKWGAEYIGKPFDARTLLDVVAARFSDLTTEPPGCLQEPG